MSVGRALLILQFFINLQTLFFRSVILYIRPDRLTGSRHDAQKNRAEDHCSFSQVAIYIHPDRLTELHASEYFVQHRNGVILLAVDNACIALGVPYGCVAEQLARRVDVYARCKTKCRKGVPGAMESDRLRKEKQIGEDKT